ncbi:hypothetical protein [Aliikangiella coralliicola]|uniref:Uncharacterized protein n=1 Tax=Aliikangiella coralliicola TaxID=2592383 RepID=A0A545U6I3_9GAMM|nr:hypothetical protein [Aliikangiella coralliicola]TQV85085.1 hypothetical protein FLL46_22105 [Aliikangiella coralliicola]
MKFTNNLFQERLSERALKARWNLLLFGAVYLLFVYSEASISQVAFLKFELGKELSHNFFANCLLLLFSFHAATFLYLAIEGNSNDLLSNELIMIKDLETPVKQLANNTGRYNQSGVVAVDDFVNKYNSALERAEANSKMGIRRYIFVDLLPPFVITLLVISSAIQRYWI